MAAPERKQYTERPRKVLAAPYDPTADPVQPGVCACTFFTADAHAHVNTATGGLRMLTAGEMLVFDAAFPDVLVAVMSIEEFEARYGNVQAVTGTEVA